MNGDMNSILIPRRSNTRTTTTHAHSPSSSRPRRCCANRDDKPRQHRHASPMVRADVIPQPRNTNTAKPKSNSVRLTVMEARQELSPDTASRRCRHLKDHSHSGLHTDHNHCAPSLQYSHFRCSHSSEARLGVDRYDEGVADRVLVC
jgi:hypothetical protein